VPASAKADSRIGRIRGVEGLSQILRPDMERIKTNAILLAVFLLTLITALTTDIYCGERKPVKPSSKDKCPVCGMFVAKYPDFLARIVFKDGSALFFDGAKDMFKCYLNLKKYHPFKKQSDVDSIYVNDYYGLNFIDGFEAFYVVGSDIYGPMGRELIPFEKEADAREFMKDHKGNRVLKLISVTPDILKNLDE
jgi:copper chaperone NosL